MQNRTSFTDARFLLFSALFVVGQPGDVVERHIVELCQGDGMMKGDLSFAALVKGVLLNSDIKNCGNLLLRQVIVLP